MLKLDKTEMENPMRTLCALFVIALIWLLWMAYQVGHPKEKSEYQPRKVSLEAIQK